MLHFGESGFLKIILGPMFSGKTSALLDIYRLYSLCNIKCFVINHSEDTRYHETFMSSHDKIMIPCYSTDKIGTILSSKDILQESQVFIINEGQFFKGLYKVVKSLVETHKKWVYVCGLDGDFKRNKFGEILDLIPLADEIEKKKALCMGCKDGTKGIFTQRISQEKEQKIIGSTNYRAVCRKCFGSPQGAQPPEPLQGTVSPESPRRPRRHFLATNLLSSSLTSMPFSSKPITKLDAVKRFYPEQYGHKPDSDQNPLKL